jgi:hypothetical protein
MSCPLALYIATMRSMVSLLPDRGVDGLAALGVLGVHGPLTRRQRPLTRTDHGGVRTGVVGLWGKRSQDGVRGSDGSSVLEGGSSALAGSAVGLRAVPELAVDGASTAHSTSSVPTTDMVSRKSTRRMRAVACAEGVLMAVAAVCEDDAAAS